MITSILIYFGSFLLSSLFYYLMRTKISNYSSLELWKRTTLCFLALLPITLTFSLRYNVGTDYETYFVTYESLKTKVITISFIFDYYLEPIWVIIQWFTISLNLSFSFFLFIVASLLSFFLSLLMEMEKDVKSSLNLFVMTMLLLFNPSMNLMRQAISIMIILFDISYLFKKKWIQYVFFILLAAGFHKSAFIALSFPFLYYLFQKDKKKIYYWIICFSPIWGILFGYLAKQLLYFISPINPYVEMSGKIGFQYLLYVLPCLFLIYLFYKYHKIQPIFKEKEIFYFKLYLLQIPFQASGSFFILTERLSFYFSPFQILLFTSLLAKIESKEYKKKFTLFVFTWLLIYYFVMFVVLNGNETYPYRFIFLK